VRRVGLRVFKSGLMSKPKAVIVDYGVGNLLSVQRAAEQCGGETVISADPDVVANADRVILPGVGAYANGMRALESLGLVQVLRDVAAKGTPLLGICLGMQLLLDQSEEHGFTKGLRIIPGRVVPVPNVTSDGLSLKIPHIGWGELMPHSGVSWEHSLLRNIKSRDSAYFVHSYMAIPNDPVMRLADCIYGGNRIPAAIYRDNVIGCQFHPEKSGQIGLKILSNFLGN
jgi:glutamine amidotransferase